MLEVTFKHDTKLDGLDDAIVNAVGNKMVALTQELYNKVIENLSGKILQQKSGQLVSSVHQFVDQVADPMTGSVYIEPASPKAWALEHGGERSYLISPSKAQVLKFFWDKAGQTVFFPSVTHPPSREFAYLRTALEEMQPNFAAGFQQVIQDVLDGKI
jgi:hypothetical protein